MFVMPEDVIKYTEFPEVVERDPERLKVDIRRAEKEVFSLCGHKFDDSIRYPTLPDEVRDAIVLLAEYYALISMEDALLTGISSEELGSNKVSFKSSQKPDIRWLLEEYIQLEEIKPKGTTFFRMRSL